MKKFWIIATTLVMVIALCAGLTACSESTVDQLTNELGALVEGGNFKEGSVLNLNEIKLTDDEATDIVEKLENSGIAINDTTKGFIYDITVTKNNAEVQPEGKVKVTVPAPEDSNADGYNVYHIKDNGSVESIPSTFEDGKITFETDGFSIYYFTPTYNCVTYHAPISEMFVEVDDIVYDITKGDVLPDFENLDVYAVSVVTSIGTYKLSKDMYSVSLGGLDITKPGEYTVTYTYKYDPDIKETVTVTVVSESVKITVENYGWGGHTDMLGEYIVAKNSEITVNAVLDDEEKYIFSGWYMNDFNTQVAGALSYTFTATEDATVIARFEKNTKVDLQIDAYCLGEGYLSDEADIMINGLIFKEENMDQIIRQLHLGKMIHLEAHSPNESLRFVGWYEVRKNDEFNDAVYREPISEETMLMYQIRNLDVHLIALFANDSPHSDSQIIGAGQDGALIVNGESVGVSTTLLVGNTYTFNVNIGEDYKFLYWQIEEYNRSFTVEKETLEYKVMPASRHVYAICERVFSEIKLAHGVNSFEFEVGTDPREAIETADVLMFSPSGSYYWAACGVDYKIDYGSFDKDTVGEYEITFICISDPQVTATVTVKITEPKTVDFSAFVEGGTIIYGGADIGPDYYEETNKGYGKITLTAKGEENTVFKGWYTDEESPKLISTDETYTFEFTESLKVFAKFDHLVTELVLDGLNAGFNTDVGYTELYIPYSGKILDPKQILVYGIKNGNRVALTSDEYVIETGFDCNNLQHNDYVIIFSLKSNPEIYTIHVVRVLDPKILVEVSVTVDAGGRLGWMPYQYYNKGSEISLGIDLRSEEEYEFIGWYKVAEDGSETLITTDRLFFPKVEEDTDFHAKIEPKITYLTVEGLESNITRIPLAKFEAYAGLFAADRDGIYACGALGKKIELNKDDYTVDLGGLNPANPAVGKYTVTYTYKADPDITHTTVVWVWDKDYSFSATQDSPDNGWLIFEGELTHEAGFQYIDGEEVTISAVPNEGYTFLGWYLVVNNEGRVEYEIISPDYSYTFIINKDTVLEAKFGAPVTDIDLIGANVDNNGNYSVTVYAGDKVDLSYIDVFYYSLVDSGILSESEYTVDFGGLDTNCAAAGTYTVVYTYNKDPEVKISLTVNVIKRSYFVHADVERGYFEYDGERYSYFFKEFEEGERIVIATMDTDFNNKEFVGWYLYNYETNKWDLYSTDKVISVVVKGNVKLRAIFKAAVYGLDFYEKDPAELYDNGVTEWSLNNPPFVSIDGTISISSDSKYANDFVGLFDNFDIVVKNANGENKHIQASELIIDLGDYKAEHGWYDITVGYGNFSMKIRVSVD